MESDVANGFQAAPKCRLKTKKSSLKTPSQGFQAAFLLYPIKIKRKAA